MVSTSAIEYHVNNGLTKEEETYLIYELSLSKGSKYNAHLVQT